MRKQEGICGLSLSSFLCLPACVLHFFFKKKNGYFWRSSSGGVCPLGLSLFLLGFLRFSIFRFHAAKMDPETYHASFPRSIIPRRQASEDMAATDDEQMVEVEVTELERVVRRIVTHSLGYGDAEAATITRILLYAQVRGNSQGVIKVRVYGVWCVRIVYVPVDPGRSFTRSLSPLAHQVLTNGVSRSSGPTSSIAIEHETKLSARLNGQGASGRPYLPEHALLLMKCRLPPPGPPSFFPLAFRPPGMLLLEKACRLAIAKGHDHGIAIVAAHGSGSGTGAIGYFGREIANGGLIGIVLSQSAELVAPFGSYEPIFGTNPFAIGIPTQARVRVCVGIGLSVHHVALGTLDFLGNRLNPPAFLLSHAHALPFVRMYAAACQDPAKPLVLDMATSAISWYAVKEAKEAGQAIPGDVAYDSHGRPTTDAAAALAGALRVFDR